MGGRMGGWKEGREGGGRGREDGRMGGWKGGREGR